MAGRLLKEEEVSQRLGWSTRTLQQRRWLGLPPAFCKIGRSVRYDEHEIERLIESSRRISTTDQGEAA